MAPVQRERWLRHITGVVLGSIARPDAAGRNRRR
jgi:hypothetical protein